MPLKLFGLSIRVYTLYLVFVNGYGLLILKLWRIPNSGSGVNRAIRCAILLREISPSGFLNVSPFCVSS
ncbi:hypothetical protein [Helicobacter aurati]|uniref:hypothetical protein n=1 Tax=Helicobacter aurati TaxID=137778 RepID=UPI001315917E|nr:hypothetical protein [Helicobacter aurati]